MTLKNRINQAFSLLPVERQKQKALADYCGLSAPSVNAWFTGASKTLKGNSLVKAAQYLDVNERWLESGRGPMERGSDADYHFDGDRKVPLLNYVQAGAFACMDGNFSYEGMEYLLTDLSLSEDAFALEIKGDSMLPEFKEGDRIIVDCSVSPRPGDFVVARNSDHEATFKRYRLLGKNEHGIDVFELVPMNKDYPSLRSDTNHIEVIGTMIEHRKYYKRIP